MRNEAEACSIFKNALDFGHKIADSANGQNMNKSPFDIFGCWDNRPVYAEVKHLKGLQSFNLQSVADHQIEALLRAKNACSSALSWVVLAVSASRGDNRFYVFEAKEIASRRLEKKNYLKKELETLPYLKVSKGAINLEELPSLKAQKSPHY